MAKFRKKPVVVEAIRFLDDPDVINKISEFVNHTVRIGYTKEPVTIKILTLEGIVDVYVGDWIVKDKLGDFSRLANETFEKTYELMEE